ncbi:MAG: hypothetical protein JJLCMIEE_03324 [Acidimicrobiales bacterium]|nr:MAG: hypothetical protein EDR02_16880 [Actinomycetota bacterium]MBV6510194.1 hypothetical protein [Acidimicrobiales bacterium]RIK03521.1 MAG: hypothetical protein DCC48_16385 [Acidobacteriota bacterium]
MPVDEGRRHALYTKLEQVLGHDQAETFMQLTPPTEWAELATHQDFEHLDTSLGARIDGLEARMDRLEAHVENIRLGLESRIDGVQAALESHVENVRVGLESRIDGVQAALESRIENVRVGLESRIDGLEADQRTREARLIGELHRLLRLQTIWLIGSIFTLAALVLTAAKLF